MKKLILGILLCVAAVAVPAILLIPLLASLEEESVAFEAPGEIEVTLDEPGRYYVWNEYRTVFEGRSYLQSETLPDGISFSFTEVESGEQIPLRTGMAISSRSGSREKESVGYFEVVEPGTYRLRIEGVEKTRIFSIGPSLFDDFFAFFGRLFIGFILVAAGMIGGILLIVFGILDLVRKGKTPPPLER